MLYLFSDLSSRYRRVFFLFLCFVLCVISGLATAAPDKASVLVIVSDRSSPGMVAGAHRLLKTHPQWRINIRTVSQLVDVSDEALQALISESTALAMVAVFGEPVERLLNANYPSNQFRYVLHSDRRLLPLSHDQQGQLFGGGIPEAILTGSKDWATTEHISQIQQQFPLYKDWLQARAYWINRSVTNAHHLLNMLATQGAEQLPMEDVSALRFAMHQPNNSTWVTQSDLTQAIKEDQPVVWLLDHDTGDLDGEWDLHQKYCAALNAQCVSVLAGWGEPSVDAIKAIKNIHSRMPATAMAIISLQDFVMGGGEGRESVDAELATMRLPVIKGMRLAKTSLADYELSAQGVPRDSVHYRVAMPELQGVSQPAVLAVASDTQLDTMTGAKVSRSEPIVAAIKDQARRVQRWLVLQQKSNADKHVAIVYYNHPPGRHNIGADNLNVPDSLMEILQSLKAAGYNTGELPANSQALLDLLQQRGVNLPEDAGALAAMSDDVATLSRADYQEWFRTLPAAVQAEMEFGPLASLHQRLVNSVTEALALDSVTMRQARVALSQDYMTNTLVDLHHALDGLRHKGRARALDLLSQLQAQYETILAAANAGRPARWATSESLRDSLLDMQIEGIRGWGEAPGRVMVWQGDMLIPGLQFGNVFIGPQPPRGWEINEELLHANLSFPPPHQYLGFYHYLQDVFAADALIHVGRHSTYEFLPKRSVGLSGDDYPSLIAGDLPGIYPYIVDGVGEGIQAKRRGLAVMVDHLTPPLAITELYDDLLQLRQLIESAEAATDGATRTRAIETLRATIDELGLRKELEASMDEELQVRGVGFDEIEDDFLLHETGHYLTNIQEKFMPLGLHVFGRDWEPSAVDTMLTSMLDKDPGQAAVDSQAKTQSLAQEQEWRQRLMVSPRSEIQALLAGLNGEFVLPGKGNDPIRTPDALPTGRNFFALDGSLLPTRVGFDIGQQLANKVLSGERSVMQDIAALQSQKESTEQAPNKQGVILWASDAVRDEGAMIAFGMKLLGVQPVWNSRGILKKLERLPLSDTQPQRLDVLFTASGLFRDLYGEHLVLLDKSILLALDASADTIKQDYPALLPALQAALEPLGEWAEGGREPLAQNRVADNWVNEARMLLRDQPNLTLPVVGRQASLRVFGDAPGSYGAGINRLVERSSAWDDRMQLADVFVKRIGHAYGSGLNGEASQDLLRRQLAGVSHTYLGRASNLYGLIDNNDAFDYLGGLNLAVERTRGQAPQSSVVNHADNRRLKIESLHQALLGELRGRFLNPQWIQPLMEEGYSGARTMGSEFIEYLWGWQVTSPDIINDDVWAAVKAVYVDDEQNLGLDEFLSEGHNRQVQTNILAVMLVAIDKGFWQADADTIQQLSQQFANNIVEVGIPGSGHTHANHPMYDLVKANISAQQAKALETVLASARNTVQATNEAPSHIQELTTSEDITLESSKVSASDGSSSSSPESSSDTASAQAWMMGALILGFLIVLLGIWRGRRLR